MSSPRNLRSERLDTDSPTSHAMDNTNLQDHNMESMDCDHAYQPQSDRPIVIPEIREGSLPLPTNDSELQSMSQMENGYRGLESGSLEMDQTSTVSRDCVGTFCRQFIQDSFASKELPLPFQPLVSMLKGQPNMVGSTDAGGGKLPGQSSPAHGFVKSEPEDALPVTTDTDESQCSMMREDPFVKMETRDEEFDGFPTMESDFPAFENFSTRSGHSHNDYGQNFSSSNESSFSSPLPQQKTDRALNFSRNKKRKPIDFWKYEPGRDTESVPGYCCKFCYCRFQTLRSLDNHIATIHLRDLSTVKSRWSLQYQGVICKKCKGKYALCIYCGEEFYGKRSIKKHILNHKLDKTFQCNICKETFFRKTSRFHLLVHKDLRANCRPCVRLRKKQNCSVNKRDGLRSQNLPRKNITNQPRRRLSSQNMNLVRKELRVVLERIDLHAMMNIGMRISIPVHVLETSTSKSKYGKSMQVSENGPDEEVISCGFDNDNLHHKRSNKGIAHFHLVTEKGLISGDCGLDKGSNITQVHDEISQRSKDPIDADVPNQGASSSDVSEGVIPMEKAPGNAKELESGGHDMEVELAKVCTQASEPSKDLSYAGMPELGVSQSVTIEGARLCEKTPDVTEELESGDHALDAGLREICKQTSERTKHLTPEDISDPGVGLLATRQGALLSGKDPENLEGFESVSHNSNEESTEVCKQASERTEDLTPADVPDQGVGLLATTRGALLCEKPPENLGVESVDHDLHEGSTEANKPSSERTEGLAPANTSDREVGLSVTKQDDRLCEEAQENLKELNSSDHDMNEGPVLIHKQSFNKSENLTPANVPDREVSSLVTTERAPPWEKVVQNIDESESDDHILDQGSTLIRKQASEASEELISADVPDQGVSLSVVAEGMLSSGTALENMGELNSCDHGSHDVSNSTPVCKKTSQRIEGLTGADVPIQGIASSSVTEGTHLYEEASKNMELKRGSHDFDVGSTKVRKQAYEGNEDFTTTTHLQNVDVCSSVAMDGVLLCAKTIENVEELESGDCDVRDGSNILAVSKQVSETTEKLTAGDELSLRVDLLAAAESARLCEKALEDIEVYESGDLDLDNGSNITPVSEQPSERNDVTTATNGLNQGANLPVVIEGEHLSEKVPENDLPDQSEPFSDISLLEQVLGECTKLSAVSCDEGPFQGVDPMRPNNFTQACADLSDHANIAVIYKQVSETQNFDANVSNQGTDLLVAAESTRLCEKASDSMKEFSNQSKLLNGTPLSEQGQGESKELSLAACNEDQFAVTFQGVDLMELNDGLQAGAHIPGQAELSSNQPNNDVKGLLPMVDGNSTRKDSNIENVTEQTANCRCSDKDNELGLLCHVCGPDFIENLLNNTEPHMFGFESNAEPNSSLVASTNLLGAIKHDDEKQKPIEIDDMQYLDSTAEGSEPKTQVSSSIQPVKLNEEPVKSDRKETVCHKRKSKTFSCRKCDKVYSSKKLLQNHVTKLHCVATRKKRTTLRDGKRL